MSQQGGGGGGLSAAGGGLSAAGGGLGGYESPTIISSPTGAHMVLPSTPRSSSPRRLSARRNVPRQWQLPSACIMRGYLGKKGGRLRKRWFNNLFLIEDGTLFICWDLTSHFLIESAIPLTNILACNKHKKDNTQFILIYNGVKNNKGAWQKCKVDIKCTTQVERDAWVNQLLEMRETARCLNSDLVDRSKAYEALQSALDEVRRAAAQAIMATISAALKGSDYRQMDRAFHALCPPQDRRTSKGGGGGVIDSGSAELGVSAPKPATSRGNRASFSMESGKGPRGGIPLEGFRAVDHLEGMLKVIYWFRAVRKDRLYHAFRKLAQIPRSPPLPPSATATSFPQSSQTMGGDGRPPSSTHSLAPSYGASLNSPGRHPLTTSGGVGMPPFAPSSGGGGVDIFGHPTTGASTAFVENMWVHHNELMAKDMVRYRIRKLVSVLGWIYRRRLSSAMTQMSLCSRAHKFISEEKAALLVHLLQFRELKEQMDKRFIWNHIRSHQRKCDFRERSLLQLLEPAVTRRRRFAVRLWYMNCVKMADRDYAAVLKLTSALQKVNLRLILMAFRRIDKHATEKASEEVMQVAQNLTHVNTKILASFHQIPVSRAVIQLCGLIRTLEFNQKRIGLNQLIMHTCRFRTLNRLSGAVVATLRNIEARICVRDPFNALRAHANIRSAEIARAQLASGLSEAGQKVKLCGCRTIARCYRQLELKDLEYGMMKFRRYNLAKQLESEQEAFLTHYSRIVKYGQRSAAEIFATKLLNWFERQRKMHLIWVWTALLDNWDKTRRQKSTQKIQATTRLVGLIDRWRCLVLNNAFQIFKYYTYDLPHTNALMIQSATQAIASAEKIAARIELSKKIEGASKNFTVAELIDRQTRSYCRPTPYPIPSSPQTSSLRELRRELNLASPVASASTFRAEDRSLIDLVDLLDDRPVIHSPSQKSQENLSKVDEFDVKSGGSVASLLRVADRFLASSDLTSSSQSAEVLPPISSLSDGGRMLVSQTASKQLAAILADSGCDWSEISEVLGEFESPRPRRTPGGHRRRKKVCISDLDKSLLSTTSDTSSGSPGDGVSDLSDLGTRKIAFVKSVTNTHVPRIPAICSSAHQNMSFVSMINNDGGGGSVSLGGPTDSISKISNSPPRTVVLRARPASLKKEAIIQY